MVEEERSALESAKIGTCFMEYEILAFTLVAFLITSAKAESTEFAAFYSENKYLTLAEIGLSVVE